MSHSDVVDENLNRARARYTAWETTTDPEKKVSPKQPILKSGEVIHIHAHGHPGAVASFAPQSLARELVRKFQAQALVGRTLLLHSCETGAEDYVETLLENLIQEADDRGVDLIGTRVFAPVGYLVVNQDGKSYVSKAGVDSSKMRDEETRGAYLRPLGEGWVGCETYYHKFYDFDLEEKVKVLTVRSIEGADVKKAIKIILGLQEEDRDLKYYDAPELRIPGWRSYGRTIEEAQENLDWIEQETVPTPHKDFGEGKVNDFYGIFGRVTL